MSTYRAVPTAQHPNARKFKCTEFAQLCQWAKHWGIHGTGVDISPAFLTAARERAHELGVETQVTLVEGDAGKYLANAQSYDVVSCIGATWIGGGHARPF